MGSQPAILSKEIEDRAGRLIEFDRDSYRDRKIRERLIDGSKKADGLLTRFEKTAKNFLGMIKIAFIHRYLRVLYG